LVGHDEGGRCPECTYEFTQLSLLADWADVKCFLWAVAPHFRQK
jgi:hypothetical protein